MQIRQLDNSADLCYNSSRRKQRVRGVPPSVQTPGVLSFFADILKRSEPNGYNQR